MPEPEVSIANEETITETDAEIDGTITVTLATASGKTVTVPYTVATGTASSDDFTLVAGDVTFTPDGTTGITPTTQTISFKIAGDTLDEGEEQFTITLGGSTLANATLKAGEEVGTVKIADNDPEPALTIDNEGEAEGTAITFTPTLGAVSGRDVIVTYYTEASGLFPVSADDYTAVAEEDATADPAVPATTITIPAGETSPANSISITTAADDGAEPDETFTLHYSADFATTTTPRAIGTIQNNDAQTLAINSREVTEDAGTVTLDVILSPAPGAGETVEVTYTHTTGTAGTSDFTHTTTDLEFTEGQTRKTLSFAIVDDSLNEVK